MVGPLYKFLHGNILSIWMYENQLYSKRTVFATMITIQISSFHTCSFSKWKKVRILAQLTILGSTFVCDFFFSPRTYIIYNILLFHELSKSLSRNSISVNPTFYYNYILWCYILYNAYYTLWYIEVVIYDKYHILDI